jgi:hypothetical protein
MPDSPEYTSFEFLWATEIAPRTLQPAPYTFRLDHCRSFRILGVGTAAKCSESGSTSDDDGHGGLDDSPHLQPLWIRDLWHTVLNADLNNTESGKQLIACQHINWTVSQSTQGTYYAHPATAEDDEDTQLLGSGQSEVPRHAEGEEHNYEN